MSNDKLRKELEKMGINTEKLTDKDIEKILMKFTKGKFSEETLIEFFKESNVSSQTLIDALKNFAKLHEISEEKYFKALYHLIDVYSEELKKAETLEEKRHCDGILRDILEMMREEVEADRNHALRLAMIGGGAAAVSAGIAVFAITRNPKVLLKGARMISKGFIR